MTPFGMMNHFNIDCHLAFGCHSWSFALRAALALRALFIVVDSS
jgi:hypothetical protein